MPDALSWMQRARERSSLFEMFRSSLGSFMSGVKALDAGVALKPTPMQKGDMRAMAEDATSGATTVLYGRVAAFVRTLCGARNPTVAAWTWADVRFIPTVIATEEGEDEV